MDLEQEWLQKLGGSLLLEEEQKEEKRYLHNFRWLSLKV